MGTMVGTKKSNLAALALVAGLSGMGMAAPTALADSVTPQPVVVIADPTMVEVGGFIGYHYFSPDDRLGRHPGFDGNELKSSAELGFRLGLLPSRRYGFELELGLMPTYTKNNTQVLEFGYRASGLVNILTGKVQPFVLLGGGAVTSSSADSTIFRSETDGEIHGGLGVKWLVRPHWGVRLDARVTFQPAVRSLGTYFTEDFQLLVSVYGRKPVRKEIEPVKDTDGDGLPDDVDKCPTVPGSHELQGCPERDADHDGVPDRTDKCPTVAGSPENAGCPDVDSDGDGIVDRMDKCPQAPGPRDNGGCPEGDADGDGIIDRLDKCPAVKGTSENGGCPDLDTDGDGIIDRLDKCPTQPETFNGYQDDDGCPDSLPPDLAKVVGPLAGFAFANDKPEPTKKALQLLAPVVVALKAHPEVRIELDAYVNGGDAVLSQKKAQARAERVKQVLVDQGIDVGRVDAKGNPPDAPIAPAPPVAAPVATTQTGPETSTAIVTTAGPMTAVASAPVVPDKAPAPAATAAKPVSAKPAPAATPAGKKPALFIRLTK